MTTKRQIEAFDRRLAKVERADQLTSEMLGVEVHYVLPGSDVVDGGFNSALLVGFTHRIGVGLFGFMTFTDIVVAETPEAYAADRDSAWHVVSAIVVSVTRWGKDEVPA
ncbi:hypothetical protein [Rhodococcus sp. IEGM 1330]|uniref:hypothetical protein n=1 Tax=Rhodococcus sp. IEGM 1330 TaxID=3082225 RepID=UPI002952A544|nr:hypothetical protein [Rhodococcus sp. IEGM 1330]MDV8022315.1 hypothetical protein [Rhodococcus sp. IEGM 1330]